MDLSKIDQRMRRLEQRYHELHRMAKAARARLPLQDGAAGLDASAARSELEDAEREKKAILSEIEKIEDSLIE